MMIFPYDILISVGEPPWRLQTPWRYARQVTPSSDPSPQPAYLAEAKQLSGVVFAMRKRVYY